MMTNKLFLFSVCFLLFSCNPSPTSKNNTSKTTSSYSTEILRYRQQKDFMFASDENSPFYQLKDSLKFEHLNYFQPDETYRIKAKVMLPEKKSTVLIYDTKGGKREMTLEAILTFDLLGKSYTLNAYGSKDDPGMFFVPFKDKTNGLESYNGGRYLEIQYNKETEIDLDFNQSFNPYCHYNHNYSCPIVPKENSLDCKILAGEKSWSAFIH